MDPTEKIDQQLDDMLLDDLVGAEEGLSDVAEDRNLTPGQAVYKGRREKIVSSEIARISEVLGIEESTQTTAKTLFDQFANSADITGNALEVLAAACLYTACKVGSVPLSPDDFVSAPKTAFSRNLLLRRVKKISSELGLDPSAFLDPHGYLDRYCDELELSGQITERAHEVIDVADDAGIGGGKSPTGRAAAAIYNAVLDHGRVVTQSDIANVADVSEVTIRNRYKEQRELLKEGTAYHSNNSSDDNTTESDRDRSHTSGSDSSVVPKSTESTQEETPIELTQAMAKYVGDAVAENIIIALQQLDSTTEELKTQTCDVCQRIGDPRSERGFGADEVTLALSIIRFASEELGEPVSGTTLRNTLDGGHHQVYDVTKIVANEIEQR